MRFLPIALALISTMATAELRPTDVEHVKIYAEKMSFGGWPANHGMWIWDNEIVVGFAVGDYKDLGPERHAIDRDTPERHYLGRSKDGGHTWEVIDPALNGDLIPEGGFLHGVERTDVKALEAVVNTTPINFAHPDFALTLRTTDINAGSSRIFYSYDRGLSWEGPFLLPNFGAPGTAARTDYVVNSKDDCHAFITVAKANGQEGRVICIRTRDGGLTWTKEGDIGPEPKGFKIMPATVRIADNELYTIVRSRGAVKRWQDAYRSVDDGKTWTFAGMPVEDAGKGNPAALIKLEDGRLCMTYGYRAEPYSIRAKLSDDNGATWSDDIVLRDDGANRDIGYTRMVQRPDGKVVVTYYINEPEFGPERYIGATIFDPDSVKKF